MAIKRIGIYIETSNGEVKPSVLALFNAASAAENQLFAVVTDGHADINTKVCWKLMEPIRLLPLAAITARCRGTRTIMLKAWFRPWRTMTSMFYWD